MTDEKDDDLNPESLARFNEDIIKNQNYIKEQIKPYSGHPRAVLIGNTGCGKSSILRCLSKKELMVKGNVFLRLEGKGIGKGLNSCTSIPIIEAGSKIEKLFIDCPGFEDNRDYKQEILNSFSMDYIFENYPNHENKFDIFLVISHEEFNSIKGVQMVSSFLMLTEMFPNREELLNNICLIITKGEKGVTGNDYFDDLKTRIEETTNPPYPPSSLVDMCNLFLKHPDRVLTFPKPTTEQKGKQYDFDDHNKLLELIDVNPQNHTKKTLKNPKHHVALSNKAKLKLKIIRNNHSEKISKTVSELCDEIYKQFSNIKNAEELQKWYDIIFKLYQSNIMKSDELKVFIQDNIPESEKYNKYIEEIAEYELFDEFIDKFLNSKIKTSCLNERLQSWTIQMVNQLYKYVKDAINLENGEKMRIESEKRIKEFQEMVAKIDEDRKKTEEKYQEAIKRQIEINEKSIKEIEELKEQLRLYQEQERERQNRIIEMQREYEAKEKERQQRMNQLNKQLEEAKNKPPIIIERRVEVPKSNCLLI